MKKHRSWTTEETNYFRENYNSQTLRELAKKFSTTIGMVWYKANQLGLKKYGKMAKNDKRRGNTFSRDRGCVYQKDVHHSKGNTSRRQRLYFRLVAKYKYQQSTQEDWYIRAYEEAYGR